MIKTQAMPDTLANNHASPALVRDPPFAPGPLRWLFVDMNSFFASVEQYDNPKWRGKPMIVVPMLTDATCAIAVSYEAKAYGIKTGTPVWDAKKMCAGLIIVMARHQRYVEIHEKIADVIEHILPVSVRCSIDEFACQLLNNENSPSRAKELALFIKQELKHEFDDSLHASIGIAPNRWLAKVASDMQKPNGLTILEAKDLPGSLSKLSLRGLNGIGENMALRLQLAGIHTPEQIYHAAPKFLRKVWKSVEGERYWCRIRGYPMPEISEEPRRSMIGHSRVLEPSLRSPQLARLVARRLLCKAATRLRRYETTAASISLSVRDPRRGRWDGARSTTRSDDSFLFLQELQVLWGQMLTELRPMEIKKISVAFTGLNNIQAIGDLYAKPEQARHASALVSIDALNSKWGKDTVTIGFLPSDKIETKIAFARIPELEEFWE